MSSTSSTKTYLYSSPFVQAQKRYDTVTLDYLDEASRQDEKDIKGILMKFAIDNELVQIRENVIYPSIEKNTGSLQWIVNWMNFRSLVDPQNLHLLLQALRQNDSLYINELIDLHVRLGMLFNHDILNIITDRVMQTISLIPYGVSEGRKALTWEEIHKEAPFLWVLFLMQTVIRTTAKPITT